MVSRIGGLAALGLFALGGLAAGCTCDREDNRMEASNEAPSAPPRLEAAPRILDLSPSDESEPAELLPYPAPPNVQPPRSGRCPSDMVDVAGMFCIDRYEVSLVDVTQGRRVSPHYPPTHRRSRDLYDRWRRKQAEATTTLGRSLEVPAPPSFQLEGVFSVKAVSEPHTVPNGYLSRLTADQACRNAGKRLCSREEWIRACRGQEDRKFPYGSSYEPGVCNVHRDTHPASLLHGSASINHLDPRLPLVEAHDGPLLRTTGGTPRCASRWGDDAIFDMVGNLDEWISDEGGVFLGGFFSRATREGCDASISSHSPEYLDYSLGTRCCRDPAP